MASRREYEMLEYIHCVLQDIQGNVLGSDDSIDKATVFVEEIREKFFDDDGESVFDLTEPFNWSKEDE